MSLVGLSNASKGLSSSQLQGVLAFSLVMDRVRALPSEDRQELFALLQSFEQAADDEERDSLQVAMQEILAQTPVTVEEYDLSATPPITAFATHVGQVLRQQRDKAGLTQQQLAEKAGLLQSHISRIERGEYSPTNKTLTKLAAALGVPLGVLDPSCE